MRDWINQTQKEILQKMIKFKLSPKYQRPSFMDTIAKTAIVISDRSSCLFYNVSAVVFKDKQIVGIGYNGPSVGDVNCSEVGCRRIVNGQLIRGQEDLCRGTHAEINALINTTVPLNLDHERNYSMLVTWRPCYNCAKYIANTKIGSIYYLIAYDRNDGAEQLLAQNNIKITQYTSPHFHEWFQLYKQTFWE